MNEHDILNELAMHSFDFERWMDSAVFEQMVMEFRLLGLL